ncbi:MAG TPA: alkaline phosphatase D family protein [Kiloniellales bacterium]|jgi:hypothetical protein|nr:alkaline phosphatase D family protein [Kiloniellales bacterium]
MAQEDPIGPILLARGGDDDLHRLSALLLLSPEQEPPPLWPGNEGAVQGKLLENCERAIWRYDFSLSRTAPYYRLGTEEYTVALAGAGRTRIAFVSCNGQEEGDLLRPEAERNALWYRLREEHEASPFHLMLHGGDQLYADPVWDCHPGFEQWQKASRREKQTQPFSEEMRTAAFNFYVERYSMVYGQKPTAWLLARVPSLMMWDDHDIFDGWGSHPDWLLDSPVAAGIFQAARKAFCLLQLGFNPDEEEQEGALDPGGHSLGWLCRFSDYTVVAPDLRSERRPNQVMGAPGWNGFRRALEAEPEGRRILLLSSVPTLGPRLSWIEAGIGIIPKLRRYEDDLRDQWQSRHHREEWIRYLSLLEQQANAHGQQITLLSGEIHLATQAEMQLASGPLHQLVASGISHPPPPKAYAAGLGLLASLGEAPLPGRPIRLLPLPGQRRIYTSKRNFLILHQEEPGQWQASWFLEGSGWAGPIKI